MKAKKLKALIPVLAVLAVVVFELILSNFSYFAFVAGGSDIKDFKPYNINQITDEEQNVTQVMLHELGFEVNSVSFSIRSDEDTQFFATVDVMVDDETTLGGYYVLTSEDVAVTAVTQKHTVYLRSAGEADSVVLSFKDYPGSFSVTDVTVNPGYDFSINTVRFLLMLLIVIAVFLYKERNTDKKIAPFLKTRRAVAVALCLCVAATAFVAVLNTTGSGTETINYPLEEPVENYNPYVQQFDAFKKGQLNLDVEPTPELLALENPYNPNARQGIYYLWDRAFFEGEYYSYFGVTPIFTVYYPIYLLTGSLPGDNFVITVFAFMTAVFFALAVMQWYKNSGRKNTPYFAAACTVFAYLSSFALLVFRGTARFYYIASMAGMAFTAAFVYFMLKALGEEKDKKRILMFALAGISFAFAFHSRVNSVLPFAITAVVFVIKHLAERAKEKRLGLCIGECAALGMPVALGLAVSFAYNYVRFGSIFDFGTAYQLTVADTSFYTLSLSGIAPAVFHYFIHPFAVTGSFPYLGFSYINLGNYGALTYVDSGLGIFAIPFMLMLFASAVIFASKRICKDKKLLLATGLVSLLVTAVLNFCLGGVIFRYTADISLYAAFLAAVIALECGEIIIGKYGEKANKIYSYAVCALGVMTVIVAFGMSLMPSGNLVECSPVIFETVKNFFALSN